MNESIWTKLKDALLKFLIDFGPNVIYAAVALFFGLFVIKFTMRLLRTFMNKSHMEPTLKTFIQSLSIFVLYALLIFVVGTILGIEASSFMAMFGAAALAIGFALQGSLANFAGGVLILAFKPFKINDLVYINDHLGYVQQIDILYTRIKTFDGRLITLPNGKVANDDMDNRSIEPYRRIEIDLNFSFDEDFDELREIITNALKVHPDLVKGEPIQVWLTGMGDYAMKVSARCWSTSDDFWNVYFEQMEAVKKALDKNDIHLAIPKRLVYQGDKN
ncbi:mechanosensitive ion channel family protein [Bizionia argentinensis JUB59]|uniref:Mechanosensitive ion channel family protein n=1 Tax=Bizionia argentinensis JUB59 TaxID=1046627 RepID=G2E9Y7_9FLAO|nr:mechanosensitive ion channel family protein [Bizionia argentinensis]EGV44906.1 mechanosensitive ion channel family protein [Bizionia argentinensis JUB59]